MPGTAPPPSPPRQPVCSQEPLPGSQISLLKWKRPSFPMAGLCTWKLIRGEGQGKCLCSEGLGQRCAEAWMWPGCRAPSLQLHSGGGDT